MDQLAELTKDGNVPYKICVSGAAETGHCGINTLDMAKELGREVVLQNGILLTGATTGFPLWSAIGAKSENGISVGFSPAASLQEHSEAYRLPTENMDLIVYTGFGYAGRDIILTRASEAVLFGCGRIGTIHEFTVAFEDNKPIGILEGQWDTDETLRLILERGERVHGKIIFDKDPKNLIRRVIELIDKDREAAKRATTPPPVF